MAERLTRYGERKITVAGVECRGVMVSAGELEALEAERDRLQQDIARLQAAYDRRLAYEKSQVNDSREEVARLEVRNKRLETALRELALAGKALAEKCFEVDARHDLDSSIDGFLFSRLLRLSDAALRESEAPAQADVGQLTLEERVHHNETDLVSRIHDIAELRDQLLALRKMHLNHFHEGWRDNEPTSGPIDGEKEGGA